MCTGLNVFGININKINIIFSRCRLYCYTDSGPAEPKTIYIISAGADLPTDVIPRTCSVLGGPRPRRRNASGFRRTRRQKGAKGGPPPEEHPPDKHAELRVPVP